MSEVRADVATAFEDPTGVFFHVEMLGRRVKAHIPFEALTDLGSGRESGEFATFVKENETVMQQLVDQGVADGWPGPLTLIV